MVRAAGVLAHLVAHARVVAVQTLGLLLAAQALMRAPLHVHERSRAVQTFRRPQLALLTQMQRRSSPVYELLGN
jgi:hypothetical protein